MKNLLTYSRQFQKQKWQRFKTKDGAKGPIVREVKRAPFYRKHVNGPLGPTHTLAEVASADAAEDSHGINSSMLLARLRYGGRILLVKQVRLLC